MPNLKQMAYKLQMALAAKGRHIKINQFQAWSDRQGRMVTRFVVCEKRLVNNKCKDVTIAESYQMADVVKSLAAVLKEIGDGE